MIKLILDGKTAALPEDIDLTLEFENPFFTKNGSYSYDIELDLNNTLNLSIFGNINRLAVRKENVKMSCLLYKNDRLFFVGNATIMSISDTTVSVQLLGDSSSIHFFSKDIYIDEMELGWFNLPFIGTYEFYNGYLVVPRDYLYANFGSVDKTPAVSFPVSDTLPENLTKNSTYPNNVRFFPDGALLWPASSFSVQPYLIRVFEAIAKTMGYNIERNDWDKTWLRNLYIVNHKKGYWPGPFPFTEKYTSALPHWSVSKFIDELEKLLAVIVLVDEHRKQIQIISLETFYQNMPTIEIPSNMIIDAYEVEMDASDTNKSLTSGNIGFNHSYKDKSVQLSLSQLDFAEKVEYSSYEEISSAFSSMDDTVKKSTLFIDKGSNRSYYAATIDNDLVLAECNIFGNLYRKGNDNVDIELNIIPAETAIYSMNFKKNKDDDSDELITISLPYSDTANTSVDKESTRSIEDVILNGAPQSKSESEVLEVMINTGKLFPLTKEGYTYPQAFTDYNMPISGRANLPKMSLSLHDVCEQSLGYRYRQIPVFDTSKPFRMTFFHPDKIDTRSILLIRNQKYVIRQFTVKMSHESDLNCYEAELYRLES